MTWTLPISGEYPPEWPAINNAVCEAAGHRCIRCLHPYKKGTHGKGEWSPCDERCKHEGPFGVMFGEEIRPVLNEFHLQKPLSRNPPLFAQWRILTVHHFDGNKANCEWWNLLCLCQRCHLQIQTRVNPHQPYMFEHSAWLRPYVAGFYAFKYRNLQLTRHEVEDRLESLLALERIA